MDEEYVFNEGAGGTRLPIQRKPATQTNVQGDPAAALEKLRVQTEQATQAAQGVKPSIAGMKQQISNQIGGKVALETETQATGTISGIDYGMSTSAVGSPPPAKPKRGRPKKSEVIIDEVTASETAEEKKAKKVASQIEASKKQKDEAAKNSITVDTILGQDDKKVLLEVAIKKDVPALLVGETGAGKTSIIRTMAKERGQKWVRFNMTGETTVDEFVGKYVLQNKQTVWEDGILLQAMKEGAWLIVDEVNVALPEILFVLHSLLDDDKFVVVANHNSEIVRPHKDFRFFGTMNPVDEYAGTKELNKAFKSRFGMILNVEYPERKIENIIVEKKGNVKETEAVKIVDVGNLIRKAKQDNQVFYTCSTRDLIQWASLVGDIGMQDAFTVAVLNKADGDGDKLKAIYKTVFARYKEAGGKGYELNLDWFAKEAKKLEEIRVQINKKSQELREQVKVELQEKLKNI